MNGQTKGKVDKRECLQEECGPVILRLERRDLDREAVSQ
jgi:hypothetical protein